MASSEQVVAQYQQQPGVEMALKVVEAVEDDAKAVASSLNSLLDSLQGALSEVTGSTVEHMRCHSETAGEVQAAAVDAASKGNRFINSCLRLNEEMKGLSVLAAQLKTLKQTVDLFEHAANRHLKP